MTERDETLVVLQVGQDIGLRAHRIALYFVNVDGNVGDGRHNALGVGSLLPGPMQVIHIYRAPFMAPYLQRPICCAQFTAIKERGALMEH